MVKKLDKILSGYSTSVTQETKSGAAGPSTFVNISDTQEEVPRITVQFIDNRIYAIHFLNNSFFDIPDDGLWLVLRALLDGKYIVKKSRFQRKYWVTIYGDNGNLIPQRIQNDADLESVYQHLPVSFSKGK